MSRVLEVEAVSVAIEHPIGPYTVEEWLALPPSVDGSNVELILGYLHVTPPPHGSHQWASTNLLVLLRTALRAAGKDDLYVVHGVGVELSTAWRTALIPDLVVLNVRPDAVSFSPDELELVVEIWSPGHNRAERETKLAAYAGAGVPHVWTVERNKLGALAVAALRLDNGRYTVDTEINSGETKTITAAPVPVEVSPSDLAV
ncbi:Uma2 family endonuclease [Crossiella equi]|uniref:Uma2 family endonuclease n=1 Tax=Crossiella equi TaxID=130796 RepID=A0ABS5ABE1_9PSEU|nr:Uma2 family endonuclease [Crossiella equi]MBP2473902.1 Uma2 family endonuclease [Crossiella equi]